jgi:hypothetical protein
MMIRAATATIALCIAFALPARADITLKSQDGTLELTVPNGWREAKPAGPAIKIQAMSGRGSIVMVRVVSREDFTDFKSFANAGVERLKRNMPDADAKVEDIQINGKPAIRAHIEGTQANGRKRGFLLTFLEADGIFIDVITSANASVFKAEEEALAGLASQLKISTASATPAPAPAAPAAPATPPAAPPAKQAPPARAPR